MVKRVIITIVIVTIVIVALIPLTYELAYMEKIYPGIKIGRIDVGNRTPQAAKELFGALIDRNNQTLRIVHPVSGQIWEIKPRDIDLRLNLDSSIQDAYLVGRQGTMIKRTVDKRKAWQGRVSIPLNFSFDQEKLDAQIATISATISVPTVSPQIILRGKQIVIDPGQPGQELDRRRLQFLITNHIAQLDRRPITLPIKIVNPPPRPEDIKRVRDQAQSLIGKSVKLKSGRDVLDILDDKQLVNMLRFSKMDFEEEIRKRIVSLAAKIDREPKDALFEFRDNRVAIFRQSQSGRKLNQEKTRLLLEEAIEKLMAGNEMTAEVALPLSAQPPNISTQEVNSLGIRERLGEGTSYFRGSAVSRLHNIQLASSRLNGLLIKPGEIFSFNQALGEISNLTGYQKAYVIKNGRTVLGDGGGVCQVSTTFFRAALNAGLPIVERQAHAYRVYYYEQKSPVGLDATVFTPSPDLKIKNDTPAHILIQSTFSAKEDKLTFSFYGTSDNRHVVLSNFRLWDIVAPPPPLYNDDPTLPKGKIKQVEHAVAGAKAAFDWQVTRDGAILQKRTFYSLYQPWRAVYLRGTKED